MKLILLSSLLILTGCMTSPTPTSSNSQSWRYVALGDSYTIGEGVREADRWPNQLVKRLQADDITIELVANPGRTGWTTQQLIDHELPVLAESDADLVTILIGVNDYVQGVSQEQFQANLETIIQYTLQHVSTDQIILVTIPDFSVTPAGAGFGDPEQIHADLLKFNQVIQAVGTANNIAVVDIFDLSSADTVTDGLHPSATQYKTWVDRIYPVINSVLTT